MKSGGPKVKNNDRTAAERALRYRKRKQAGVVCMVQVPIYALDTDALVKCGRLGPEDEKNRTVIAEAVEALIDDFTEGKLVRSGDV